MSKKQNPRKRISFTAISLSIGLIFGGIVGVAIDNMIIFAGGGLVLGFAIGSAMDNRLRKINL